LTDLNCLTLPTAKDDIRMRTLAKGEGLFYQGDEAMAIFVVRKGRVRLVRHLMEGRSVSLYVAQAGQSFAEAALFSSVYHCDAIADVASEIEVHSKASVLQALDTSHQASLDFLAHMSRQVMALRTRLEIRNIRSAKERVLQFLQLEVQQADMTVTFAGPLKDVAADIGLSHEAFYRALSELQSLGLISRSGRSITCVS